MAEAFAVIARLLDDVGELLDGLLVAGLSYTDPELPEQLRDLGERAARAGMETLVGLLNEMGSSLPAPEARSSLPAPEARNSLGSGPDTFTALQRLSAWQRLYRREHTLLVVGAELERSRGQESAQSEASGVAARVWPMGLKLKRNALTLYGVEVDTGEPVQISDELSDHEPDDLFAGPVISRLFQAKVELRRVMRSMLVFEDHPVVRRRGHLQFAPAFRTVPKPQEMVEGYLPPDAHPLPLRPRLGEEGVEWYDPEGKELELGGGEVLWLNAAKWCLFRGGPIPLLTRATREGARILHAIDEIGGPVFPDSDPRLFRQSPTALYRAALAQAEAQSPVEGLWTRSVAVIYGGLGAPGVQALRELWSEVQPRGLREHYLRAMADRLLFLPPREQSSVEVVGGALALAVAPKGRVDLVALRRVLGRDAVAPADLRALDEVRLYEAVWLCFEHELEHDLEANLRALYTQRYGAELSDPSPADIAARCLLLRFFDAQAAEEDEGTVVGAGAMEFLEAHLERWRPKRGAKSPAPLPGLLELWWLGHARAVLEGAGQQGPVVARLGLSRLRIARLVADALLAEEDTAAAWLIVASAGLRPWFVE